MKYSQLICNKRFICTCRNTKAIRISAILSTQDFKQALTCLVRMVQQISYAQEIRNLMLQQEVASSSSLKTLHRFIDKEGLLREGVVYSNPRFFIKTMKPSNHHFTKMFVTAEHTRLQHTGPQLLIAYQRQRFWIPRIRNLVKTVTHLCLTCYRFMAQTTQQVMGELPSTRVQSSRPFLTTGVDYAGPISLRLGPPRSKTITKGYSAILVFFVTKAVHIEVVTSLSTEAFLVALRRLV